MEGHAFIGSNRSEDVKWLNSLSESDLDILIRMKKLVLQRVQVVGAERLAKQIDLRWLRALAAFVVMQFVKGQLKDLEITEASVLEEVLSRLNMLNLDQEDSDADANVETDDLMQ